MNGRARSLLGGSNAAILMYHRVLPPDRARSRAVEPGMYVSPETFALQMSILKELFSVLPLHEIVTRMRDGRRLPERACAITFDDGWYDNLENALPVLEAHGLPATVFVVTGRVGTMGAFWPDEVSRRLSRLVSEDRRQIAAEIGMSAADGSVHGLIVQLKRVSEVERLELLERLRQVSIDPFGDQRELLDWDELADLSRRGVDVESHGVSHAILTAQSHEEAGNELKVALQTLRGRGHGQHRLLAYPSGEVDSEVVRLASEVGYAAAVTTETGVANGDSNLLTLPRIGLHEDISSTRSEFLRRVPGPIARFDRRDR